ncbi:PP2C family protein-serine/threonine phosphatase [Streptomyces sp. NPDC052107]|uniref:PP2C family protein-serine/threonine phosphatase n=1 Tax=Streptomyces sp. NPDC052107 TaxID=3155632 RepID=UPI003444192E
MAVQVKEPITSRSTSDRSLPKVTAPKRLSRRMREGSRPFSPALLTPLLVIVLVMVADLLTPHLQFYRLLGAVPALAAAVFAVPGTLGIGLLALAAGVGLAAADHSLGQTPGNFTLLALTAVTLAAAYASRVRQNRERTLADRERTLAEVRAVAETAQRVLLRPVPQHLGHVGVEVLYQAAAAQASIGGDFYEVHRTRHGVRLIIGDVRGKGLSAVEAASDVLSSFRVSVHDAPDLPSLAGRLETTMNHYSEEAADGDDALELFVTIVLVEIPAREPVARLINCGHPPPLLLHGGEVREVEPSAPSPPINMAALLGDHYQADTIPFATGDRLLLYTDGVSETRDRAGNFYPLTQRVRQWALAPPRGLLDHLRQDILDYMPGTRDDDLAALVAYRATPCAREPAQLDRAVPVPRGRCPSGATEPSD